ncbi:MAG: LPS-assembly protein LptD [Myxococcota bacterium]
MTAAIPLALALYIAGQLPLATEVEPSDGRRIELAADQLVVEGKHARARGNAVLRVQGAVVRANEILYDQTNEVASAKGNVRLVTTVNGLYAAVAEHVTVKVEDGIPVEVSVSGGLVMQKRNVSAEQLLAAQSAEELRDLGITSLILSGTRLTRRGASEWAVEELSFTPCDCDLKKPSWRIGASSANIDVEGEHATLWFPRVYLDPLPFPVLALPWVYLPLSERRTGLLVPKPSFSSLNGFSLEQPVFFALGRSYDLTLTPGYFFGAKGKDGNDTYSGIRGPRLSSEFRYVPSQQTNGRVTFGTLLDQKARRDPLTGAPLAGARGLRFEGSLQHAQDLGAGWHDRADVSVVSDGFYVRDLTADVVARESEYLRSTGVLFHRGVDHYLGLDVGLRQELRSGYHFFEDDLSSAGEVLRGPNTFHRLPGVLLSLPEQRVAGPLRLGLRTEFVRLAPFVGVTSDETSGAPYDGRGDRVFQPGERQARDRLDLMPRVSATLVGGRFGRLTPYAAYRQDFYFGEYDRAVRGRGYPLGGVVLDSEVSRVFGEGQGSLRHLVAPTLELRYVPRVFGHQPVPYDEIDLALSGKSRMLQLVAEMRQRLLRKEGLVARELVRLDLGQGFDLLDRQGIGPLADTFARLSTSYGWLGLSVLGRYDAAQGRVTQLAASLHLDTGRGHTLWAGYDKLFNQGSDRSRRGIDLLVGSPSDPALAPAYAEQLTAGARVAFKFGLTAQYDLLLGRERFEVGGAEQFKLSLRQHGVGVSYGPACDCWRLGLHAVQRPDVRAPRYLLTRPDLAATLSITRFGSFGTGG